MNLVFARLLDVEEELHGHPGVDVRRALFAIPRPLLLLHRLPALAGRGPLAIQADMHAVIFAAGGERPHPDVIAPRRMDVHFVMQDRHQARLVGEVLALDELVGHAVARVSGRISR